MVVVRLASVSRTSSELAELVGLEPSARGEKGELMSPRNPRSQVRDNSLANFDSGLEPERPLKEHLRAVTPVLERLAAVPDERRPDDLDVDLLIHVEEVFGDVCMSGEFVRLVASAEAEINVWIGTSSAD